MPYYDERPVVVEREDGASRVGSTIIWSLTAIIIVGILAWVIMSSGFLRPQTYVPRKVDVNISVPNR